MHLFSFLNLIAPRNKVMQCGKIYTKDDNPKTRFSKIILVVSD